MGNFNYSQRQLGVYALNTAKYYNCIFHTRSISKESTT